jgi:hypothetical protein
VILVLIQTVLTAFTKKSLPVYEAGNAFQP